mgnify:FL=1
MHEHSFDSGYDFGQHISDQEKHGKLCKEHNPVHHKGFSPNAPGNPSEPPGNPSD